MPDHSIKPSDQSEPRTTIDELLDYVIRLRDQLDDDTENFAESVLWPWIPVRKAFLFAEEFNLVRSAECPEQPLNREGARRKLDRLILLIERYCEEHPLKTDRSKNLEPTGNCKIEKFSRSEHQKPRKKRSTSKGDAKVKFISALTKHHNYDQGSCLCQEPIGNNELARLAGIDKATASELFKKNFGGFSNYKVVCRDPAKLAIYIKQLNGEFAPKELFSRNLPGEE